VREDLRDARQLGAESQRGPKALVISPRQGFFDRSEHSGQISVQDNPELAAVRLEAHRVQRLRWGTAWSFLPSLFGRRPLD
jgi:hypothetical protein